MKIAAAVVLLAGCASAQAPNFESALNFENGTPAGWGHPDTVSLESHVVHGGKWGARIVPDLEKRPTIAGIRAGRDEVLEEAIRQVLGRDPTAKELAVISGK